MNFSKLTVGATLTFQILTWAALSFAQDGTGPVHFFRQSENSVFYEAKDSDIKAGVLGPAGKVNIVPITLNADGSPDKASLLYHVLESIVKRPHSYDPSVTVSERIHGTLPLTYRERLKFVFNFLNHAFDTFHYEGGKAAQDTGLAAATWAYLEDFFPETLRSISEVDRHLISPELRDIVSRQTDSQQIFQNLKKAKLAMMKAAIFIGGYAALDEGGAFFQKDEEEKFVQRADKLFESVSVSLRRATTYSLGSSVFLNDKVGERLYTRRLSEFIRRVFVDEASPSTRNLVMGVFIRRLGEAEERLGFSGFMHDFRWFDPVVAVSVIVNLQNAPVLSLLIAGSWGLGKIDRYVQSKHDKKLFEAIMGGVTSDICNAEFERRTGH